MPPDLRDQKRNIVSRLRRGKRIDHFEVERLRKDGTRIRISLTISPSGIATATSSARRRRARHCLAQRG